MNLLIYGYNGLIGTQFVNFLKNEKEQYTLGLARLDDTSSLLQELDTINPSHVISFIGRTHGTVGDKVYTTIEQPGKLVENIKDNLFSPISLAIACNERKIHYTYLGTLNFLDLDILLKEIN